MNKFANFISDFYGTTSKFSVNVCPASGSSVGILTDDEGRYLRQEIPRYTHAHIRDPRIINFLVENEVPFCYEDHNELHNLHITQQELEGLSSKFCKIIIAITDMVKRRLVEYGLPQEKVVVMDSGVVPNSDNRSFKIERCRRFFQADSDKKIVVYGGGLQAERGVSLLLGAALLMPDVEFVVAGGSKKDQAKLRQERDMLRIENLRICGFVPTPAFRQLCQAADAVVLTRAQSYREAISSPLKLFDYLASGTPVVTMETQPVLKALEGGKNLACITFSREYASDLVAALHRVFEEWPRVEEGYSQNTAWAQRFSWKTRQKKIIDLLLG